MPALRAPRPRFVYFVRRADGEGPVKIGCSEYPETRVTTLAVWSPYPLAIVATLPGDEALERQFHTLFIEHWSHREWFHGVPAIEQAIREINAGTFDLSALPQGKRLRSANRKNFCWTLPQRLNAAISRRFYATGFDVSPEVRAAYDRLKAGTSEDAAADEALVRAYINKPWELGVIAPWGWAIEKATACGKKHGFTVAAAVKKAA